MSAMVASAGLRLVAAAFACAVVVQSLLLSPRQSPLHLPVRGAPALQWDDVVSQLAALRIARPLHALERDGHVHVGDSRVEVLAPLGVLLSGAGHGGIASADELQLLAANGSLVTRLGGMALLHTVPHGLLTRNAAAAAEEETQRLGQARAGPVHTLEGVHRRLCPGLTPGDHAQWRCACIPRALSLASGGVYPSLSREGDDGGGGGAGDYDADGAAVVAASDGVVWTLVRMLPSGGARDGSAAAGQANCTVYQLPAGFPFHAVASAAAPDEPTAETLEWEVSLMAGGFWADGAHQTCWHSTQPPPPHHTPRRRLPASYQRVVVAVPCAARAARARA
jgi:hypothetical protein